MDKKMRICFIAAGAFTHIQAYLDYFKEAGHDVHFVCISPSPNRGVPTYNLGIGAKYSEKSGKWKYPVSMLRARRLISKLKPDLVHAHYATSAGLTAFVCGYHPYIVTAHGSDVTTGVRSRVWKRLLRVIFKHCDCVNAVSEDLAVMVESLDIERNKIEVLTLGIDIKRFNYKTVPAIDTSRPLRMVCTRRLEPIFGHDTIIEALMLLKQQSVNCEVTFVGDGSMAETLRGQAADAGLDNVSFLGRVANDDLPRILRDHHVYLSASLWDGTSLSLLEAMATGVFPIVSNIKANSAWISHGVDGFLHEVGDAQSLANCVRELLARPEIVQTAVLRNREIVVQNGNRRKNMSKLETIYKQLAARTTKLRKCD